MFVREYDKNLITFVFNEDKTWFTMKFDHSRLRTTGFNAIKCFLRKLHINKCIGDVDGAKFFNKYC